MVIGSKQSAEPISFEADMQELEQLVAKLESGDLLKVCRERLEAVETQVKVLDQDKLKAWTPE